jgi:hypothetical protein
LFLSLFLVPGLSAVGNLWQQGPDPLNIFLTPGSYLVPTDNLCLGRGYLSILNVTGESGHSDTEFLGGLARGKLSHREKCSRYYRASVKPRSPTQRSQLAVAEAARSGSGFSQTFVLHTLKGKSDFYGVRAAGNESVIIKLKRRPPMQKLVETAQSEGGAKSPERKFAAGRLRRALMAKAVAVATASLETGVLMSPLRRLNPARKVLRSVGLKMCVSSAVTPCRRSAGLGICIKTFLLCHSVAARRLAASLVPKTLLQRYL